MLNLLLIKYPVLVGDEYRLAYRAIHDTYELLDGIHVIKVYNKAEAEALVTALLLTELTKMVGFGSYVLGNTPLMDPYLIVIFKDFQIDINIEQTVCDTICHAYLLLKDNYNV